MTAFLGELFRDGREEPFLERLRAWRTGKLLVVDGRDLEGRHSLEAVGTLSSEMKGTLVAMRRAFRRSPSEKKSLDFALSDDRSERRGPFRLLFPHNTRGAHRAGPGDGNRSRRPGPFRLGPSRGNGSSGRREP